MNSFMKKLAKAYHEANAILARSEVYLYEANKEK